MSYNNISDLFSPVMRHIYNIITYIYLYKFAVMLLRQFMVYV